MRFTDKQLNVTVIRVNNWTRVQFLGAPWSPHVGTEKCVLLSVRSFVLTYDQSPDKNMLVNIRTFMKAA